MGRTPVGPDLRCEEREAAKPWGTGWWVCTKMLKKDGSPHVGRHSYQETVTGYNAKKVKA